MVTATFKDQHPEFQELVRQFATHPEPLTAAGFPVVFAFLDKFLRAILVEAGEQPNRGASTKELLEMCCAQSRQILGIPGFCCNDPGLRFITNMRAAIIHGDYTKDMAVLQEGNWSGSEADYVTKVLPKRLHTLYFIIDRLVAQIDPATGKPRQRGGYVAKCDRCKGIQ